jgi:uncharacterized protein
MSNDLPDLPELVDPWRAVAQAQQYAGSLAVDALPRLRALVAESVGELSYSLHFGRDDARRAVVQISTKGVLRLRCQRCLQEMDWPVDEQSVLALVQGLDEAARLPECYDPLMLAETLLRPRVLIEDEVLLAIPAIARHLRCEGSDSPTANPQSDMLMSSAAVLASEDEQTREASDVQSPFAVLADWKADRS